MLESVETSLPFIWASRVLAFQSMLESVETKSSTFETDTVPVFQSMLESVETLLIQGIRIYIQEGRITHIQLITRQGKAEEPRPVNIPLKRSDEE